MADDIKTIGVPGREIIDRILPGKDRRAEKGYAIIECFQEIPCDPCTKACPKGAIKPMTNINEKPTLDLAKCDGCGLCIATCPGLAIFAVEEKGMDAIVKLPHEFNPPKAGKLVQVMDRQGHIIGKFPVERVMTTKSRTNVVWVKVPVELANKVRAIKPR